MRRADLLLLGAAVGLRLQEVDEFGLLRDGSLHFHLLMGVDGLQVELSEHHYCHQFLLRYLSAHRATDSTVCMVCVCVGGGTWMFSSWYSRSVLSVFSRSV